MNENDFNDFMYGGVFLGTALVQKRGEIGGNRFVFVKLQGIKNQFVFPTTGGRVVNPPKNRGKMYAGDLVEYRYNGGTTNGSDNAVVILMKTFEVAKAVEAAGTEVLIARSGFRHIPEVGMILMKAPDTLDGTGTSATVTAVEKTTDAGADVWKLTLSAAIGALTLGDVLVEGTTAGAGDKMLVQNPNAMLPCDYDFSYIPAVDENDWDGAEYMLTPTLGGTAYIHRMSPMPPAVLKERNVSLVKGWFTLRAN